MKNPVTILLADDHPLFRKGLRDLISSNKNYKVIVEVSDGDSASEEILNMKPDIAILDVDMPKKNGLEVARLVQSQGLETNIIILTMYKDEFFFNEAMDAGVHGYVLKESAIDDILESIQAVSEGKYYISPLVSNFLVSRSTEQATLRTQTPLLDSLTRSERKILNFIAQGKSTSEIAEVLFISPKTVENHRTNISQKLNLHGTHSLVKFAIANKSIL
ncbi:MAG: response regulator transcription factor [Ignavibacteriae bacterium]|nr:response regulator transcription factor [Ignavibacteriota bacterium]